MARMVSRKTTKEGRGIGEFISESIVWILIVAGLIGAAWWYFMIYRKSPGFVLQSFMGAMNSGNYKAQYDLLSSNTKTAHRSARAYETRWKMARGLSARIQNYTIDKMTESGAKAEADLSVSVRKSTESLLSAESEKFTDHYVLKKEADGWKVDLANSKINVEQTASTYQSYND